MPIDIGYLMTYLFEIFIIIIYNKYILIKPSVNYQLINLVIDRYEIFIK